MIEDNALIATRPMAEIRSAAYPNPVHARNRRIGLLAAILILMIQTPLAMAAQPAPDFTLPDLSGHMVSLKDFRGHYVIVDFWATWCIPCRKSLPELAAIAKKYKDRNLVVLGLAIDNPDSFDNQYIIDFIKKYNVEYAILRADHRIVTQYLGADDPNVPTLFMIDKNGGILEKHEGFEPGKLEQLIEKWLPSQ